MKKLLFLIFTALIAVGCATSKKSGSIPIIDTHIHLYDTSRAEGVPWPPETDKVLYKPILTKDFDRVSDENGVNATVIVEASKWVSDNQWVLDLVKHDPDRYIGLVGSLEIGTPDFKKYLFQLSKDKRYVGIRMRERPGGDSFFESNAVWADLRLLADMGQTLDVLMFQFSLDDVDRMAKRLPKLRILINHVAGADIVEVDHVHVGLHAGGEESAVAKAYEFGGVARLPKTLELHDPALVVLELGGNDGLRGYPINKIRDNLRRMTRDVIDHGAAVMLIGMVLPPNYGRRYVAGFEQSFHEVADELRVPLLPHLLDGVTTDRALLQPDGIHPTQEAQTLLLKDVWPMLKPLLEAL